MSIYDPIAEALNLTPTHVDFNDLVEGVDYFPWKHSPPANKGVPMSDEQKILISNAHKGRKKQYRIWNTGIPCPDHIKEILSKALKGKKQSAETCRLKSEKKLGKKRKPFTEETKRKMSEAAKRQWLENPITRNPMSEETKKKISDTKKAINRTNDREF